MSEREVQHNPEVAETEFEVNVDAKPEPAVTIDETLRTPASGVDNRSVQEPFQEATTFIDPSALNDEYDGPPVAETADAPSKLDDPEYQARLAQATQDLQAVLTDDTNEDDVLEK